MLADYQFVVSALEDIDAMCSNAQSLQKSDIQDIKGRLETILQGIIKIKNGDNDAVREASNTQAQLLLEEAYIKVTKLCNAAENEEKNANEIPASRNLEMKHKGTHHEDTNAATRRASIEATILKPGKVKFSDVAGLEKAKQHLHEAIVLPLKFPHLFQGQIKPWSRILVYGPPGTGKSFLAKAVSSEIDATFYSVSSSDLLSSWFGESERLIKELFAHAHSQKRSVIFIDEIDSLCRKRDSREDEQVRRIKTELLKQMEGADSANTNTVFMLCATNCPGELDTAFLRRFQKRIYIPLPDIEARRKMFQVHLRSCEYNLTEHDWEILLKNTEGYSGSDIATCVSDALLEPIREIDSTQYWKWSIDRINILPCAKDDPQRMTLCDKAIPFEKIKPRPVSFKDLERSISNNPKTVNKNEIRAYENFASKEGPDDVTNT